jgi:uncharacterized protein (TIGR03382 family)
MEGATVPPSFDVQTSIVDEDLAEATLSIDGAHYATATAAPFSFTVRDLALGSHTLLVTATDAIGQATTRTVHVTVASPEPDHGGGGDRSDQVAGGCAATGSAPPLVLLAFVGLAYARRRRLPCNGAGSSR